MSVHGAAAGFPLYDGALIALVRAALEEDRAFDDVTTLATVTPGHRVRADFVARQDGVIAGLPLAVTAFQLLDAQVDVRVDAKDGAVVKEGQTLLHLSGSARGLLSAERVALNFSQRLSGVVFMDDFPRNALGKVVARKEHRKEQRKEHRKEQKKEDEEGR